MEANDRIYKLTIIAILVGIILTILLFLLLPKEEGFTQLFFIPDSYSSNLNEDRNISFSYIIINNQSKEFIYDVEISYDNTIVENKNIMLKNKEQYSENVSFIVPENMNIPIKVSVNLKNLDQSIYFWIENAE